MFKNLLKVAGIFMVLSALWGGLEASAQNRANSGKVVDANGEPVIGAGVLVPGTTNGATTDLDGVSVGHNKTEGLIKANSKTDPTSDMWLFSCYGYNTFFLGRTRWSYNKMPNNLSRPIPRRY